MGILFTALVVAAVIVWLVKRSRGPGSEPAGELVAAGFRLAFRRGRLTRTEGRVPRTVLHAFEDIAAEADLDGDVRLADDGLRFSDGVPEGVRQQLRNAYFASRHVH